MIQRLTALIFVMFSVTGCFTSKMGTVREGNLLPAVDFMKKKNWNSYALLELNFQEILNTQHLFKGGYLDYPSRRRVNTFFFYQENVLTKKNYLRLQLISLPLKRATRIRAVWFQGGLKFRLIRKDSQQETIISPDKKFLCVKWDGYTRYKMIDKLLRKPFAGAACGKIGMGMNEDQQPPPPLLEEEE